MQQKEFLNSHRKPLDIDEHLDFRRKTFIEKYRGLYLSR